ncbi:DUF6088 family protein [Rheinheimera baltica]|uniref:DUF6088 family protein n=1 Tax=Rheinheimera baltica TaxID=67576 RepID=A0ABT9I271_9GAMM|nr:DUF6088 family protein [Rheinheimera baltica]MDP5137480.1 DUF6088 family protein [Rheinheimera baltica]
MSTPEPLENTILSRIYGHRRGWAFSKKDFSDIGEAGSIDRALSRMAEKGVIRRVIRGLYDYPAYSKLLKKNLSPDIDQVAHAMARKFGWQIQISGNAALNVMGLSTQVPTQYLYLSDGPSKTYEVGNIAIEFKKTRFTQLGLKYKANEILVQAIQALGDRTLRQDETQKIIQYLVSTSGLKDVAENGELNEMLINRVLKDIQYVTSWIVSNIRQVLLNKEAP